MLDDAEQPFRKEHANIRDLAQEDLTETKGLLSNDIRIFFLTEYHSSFHGKNRRKRRRAMKTIANLHPTTTQTIQNLKLGLYVSMDAISIGVGNE